MAKKRGCKCPKKFEGKKVHRNKRGGCYIKRANGQYRFVAKVGACGKKAGKKAGSRKRKCPKGCKKAA